jgi:hypothetical protein
MNNRRNDSKTKLKSAKSAALIVSLVWFLIAPAAKADDTALMPEIGTIDASPTPPPQAAVLENTVLQGGVKKHQHPDLPPADPQNQPMQAGAGDNQAALQANHDQRDDDPLFQEAAAKLDAGKKLTAEEYRSLQAGCCGYESDRTFFTSVAKVSVVYKDSPAEKAGIHRGDKIYDPQNDDEARSDPTQPRHAVTCGRAGTDETIILLKHNQKVPVTLTRMNIEDIQEPEYRHEWEKVLRQLGYPKDGTYSGTSMKNLKRVD